MGEHAILFGTNDSLAGVMSDASTDETGGERPWWIFVGPGMTHHVGPHCIHVALARALASTGASSLRFDFSGRGDSPTSDDPGRKLTSDDLESAIGAVARNHRKIRFILFGIASSADDCLEMAARDERICGLFLVDPPAYRDSGYYLTRARRRLNPANWVRAFRIRRTFLTPERMRLGEKSYSGLDYSQRSFPGKHDTAELLRTLAGRGVELCFSYTGGAIEYFNSEAQFGRNFSSIDFGERLALRYFPSTDGSLSFLESRLQLVGLAVEWMATKFR